MMVYIAYEKRTAHAWFQHPPRLEAVGVEAETKLCANAPN